MSDPQPGSPLPPPPPGIPPPPSDLPPPPPGATPPPRSAFQAPPPTPPSGYMPSAGPPSLGMGLTLQQFGGAAGWSIGLGLAGIIVPVLTAVQSQGNSTYFFYVLPIVGLINGVRAFQRGRLIGGAVGIVLNILAGLASLIASGVLFGSG